MNERLIRQRGFFFGMVLILVWQFIRSILLALALEDLDFSLRGINTWLESAVRALVARNFQIEDLHPIQGVSQVAAQLNAWLRVLLINLSPRSPAFFTSSFIVLWLAGVPYTMVLTLISIFLSLVPFVGISLVAWPVSILLIISGNPLTGVGAYGEHNPFSIYYPIHPCAAEPSSPSLRSA